MPAEQERCRTRVSSKIERLPPKIKVQVDDLLADNSNTFQYISDWIMEQGFEISRGSVSRYAQRMSKIAQRVAESFEQTKMILDRIERNPDIDPAKAAQAIMTNGLLQRMSTTDEEYFEMPLEKAGRLLASFRRVNIAERKVQFDMRGKIDLAFEQMEGQIMDTIRHDPALSAQLREILTKAKDLITDEE